MALATASKYRKLKIMNNHGRYPRSVIVVSSASEHASSQHTHHDVIQHGDSASHHDVIQHGDSASHHDVIQHGDSASWKKLQNTIVPYSIQMPDHVLSSQNLSCISADNNIFEIMNKAQETCNGTDMRCTFYHFLNHGYKNLGTLDVNKERFDDLLMKFDNWLLTAENIEKRGDVKTKEGNSSGTASIDENDGFSNDNSSISTEMKDVDTSQALIINKSDDDRVHSHHLKIPHEIRHKINHGKDHNSVTAPIIHGKQWKNENLIKLNPEYNANHRYFEVYIPKDKVTGKPRTIYVEVDQDKNEFILIDEEIDKKLNGIKPIRIELNELSEIADTAFNEVAKSSNFKEHVHNHLTDDEKAIISDISKHSAVNVDLVHVDIDEGEQTQNSINPSVSHPYIYNIEAEEQHKPDDMTGNEKKITNNNKNLKVPSKYINQAQFNIESHVDNSTDDMQNDHFELLESNNTETDINTDFYEKEEHFDTLEFNENNTFSLHGTDNSSLDYSDISYENDNDTSTDYYELPTEHENVTSDDDYFVQLEEHNDTGHDTDYEDTHDLLSSNTLNLNEFTVQVENPVQGNKLKSTPFNNGEPKLTSSGTAGISEYTDSLHAIPFENRREYTDLHDFSLEPSIPLKPYTSVPILGKDSAKILKTDSYLTSSPPAYATLDLHAGDSNNTLSNSVVEHPSITSYCSPLDTVCTQSAAPKISQYSLPIFLSPPVTPCPIQQIPPSLQETILSPMDSGLINKSPCETMIPCSANRNLYTTVPYLSNPYLKPPQSMPSYLEPLLQTPLQPASKIPTLDFVPIALDKSKPCLTEVYPQEKKSIQFLPFAPNSQFSPLNPMLVGPSFPPALPCPNIWNNIPYLPYTDQNVKNNPVFLSNYLTPTTDQNHKPFPSKTVPLSIAEHPCSSNNIIEITPSSYSPFLPVHTSQVQNDLNPSLALERDLESLSLKYGIPLSKIFHSIETEISDSETCLPTLEVLNSNLKYDGSLTSQQSHSLSEKNENVNEKNKNVDKELLDSDLTYLTPLDSSLIGPHLELGKSLDARDSQSYTILSETTGPVISPHVSAKTQQTKPMKDSSLIGPQLSTLSSSNILFSDDNRYEDELVLSESDSSNLMSLDASLTGHHLKIGNPPVVLDSHIKPLLSNEIQNINEIIPLESDLIDLTPVDISQVDLTNELVQSSIPTKPLLTNEIQIINEMIPLESDVTDLTPVDISQVVLTNELVQSTNPAKPLLINETPTIIEMIQLESDLTDLTHSVMTQVDFVNEQSEILQQNKSTVTSTNPKLDKTAEYLPTNLVGEELLLKSDSSTFTPLDSSLIGPELNLERLPVITDTLEDKLTPIVSQDNLQKTDIKYDELESMISPSSLLPTLQNKPVRADSNFNIISQDTKLNEELIEIPVDANVPLKGADFKIVEPVKPDLNFNLNTQNTQLNEKLSLDNYVEIPLADTSQIFLKETDSKIIEPIPELHDSNVIPLLLKDSTTLKDKLTSPVTSFVDYEPQLDSSLIGTSILPKIQRPAISSTSDSSIQLDNYLVGPSILKETDSQSPVIETVDQLESFIVGKSIDQNLKPPESTIDSNIQFDSSLIGPTVYDSVTQFDTSLVSPSLSEAGTNTSSVLNAKSYLDASLITPSLYETVEASASSSASSQLDSSLLGTNLKPETEALEVSHVFDSIILDSTLVGPYLSTLPFSTDEVQVINNELHNKLELANLIPLDSTLVGPHVDFESQVYQSEISQYQNPELSLTSDIAPGILETIDFLNSDYVERHPPKQNTASSVYQSDLQELIKNNINMSPTCSGLQPFIWNTLLNTPLTLLDDTASEFSPITLAYPEKELGSIVNRPCLDPIYYSAPQTFAAILPYAHGVPQIPITPYSPSISIKQMIDRNWIPQPASPGLRPAVGNPPVPLTSNTIMPLASEDLKLLMDLAAQSKTFPQLFMPNISPPMIAIPPSLEWTTLSNNLPLEKYILSLPKKNYSILPANLESSIYNSENTPIEVDDIMSLLDENSYKLLKNMAFLPLSQSSSTPTSPVFEKGQIVSPSLLDTLPIFNSDFIKTRPVSPISVSNAMVPPSPIYTNPQIGLYNPQNIPYMIPTPNILPCNLLPHSYVTPLDELYSEIVSPVSKIESLPIEPSKSSLESQWHEIPNTAQLEMQSIPNFTLDSEFLQQLLSKPCLESPKILPSSLLELSEASDESKSFPFQSPTGFFTPAVSPAFTTTPLSNAYTSPVLPIYASPLTNFETPTYSGSLATVSPIPMVPSPTVLPPSYISPDLPTYKYSSTSAPVNTLTQPSSTLSPAYITPISPVSSTLPAYNRPLPSKPMFNLKLEITPQELENLKLLNTLPISNANNPFFNANQMLHTSSNIVPLQSYHEQVPKWTPLSSSQIKQIKPCGDKIGSNLQTTSLTEETPYELIEENTYSYSNDKNNKYYEDYNIKHPLESLSYTLAPERPKEDFIKQDLTLAAPITNLAFEPSLQSKLTTNREPLLRPCPTLQLMPHPSLIEPIPQSIFHNIRLEPSLWPLNHPVSLPSSGSSTLLNPLTPLTPADNFHLLPSPCIDTYVRPYKVLPTDEKLSFSSPYYSATSQDMLALPVDPRGLRKVISPLLTSAFSQVSVNSPFLSPTSSPTSPYNLNNYIELPLTYNKPESTKQDTLVKPMTVPSYNQYAAPIISHISPLEIPMSSKYISPLSTAEILKKPPISSQYISSILPVQTSLDESCPLNEVPLNYQPYIPLPTGPSNAVKNIFNSALVTSPYTVMPSVNTFEPMSTNLNIPQWLSFTPQYSLPVSSSPVSKSSPINSLSNVKYSTITPDVSKLPMTNHIIPSSLFMSSDTNFQAKPLKKLSPFQSLPRYSYPSPTLIEPVEIVPYETPKMPLGQTILPQNMFKPNTQYYNNGKHTASPLSSSYLTQPLETLDSFQTQPLPNVQYTNKYKPISPILAQYASPPLASSYTSLPLVTVPNSQINKPRVPQYTLTNVPSYDAPIQSSALAKNPFLKQDFKLITEVPSYPVQNNQISPLKLTPHESILLSNLKPLDISKEALESSPKTSSSSVSLLKPLTKTLTQKSGQYQPEMIPINSQYLSLSQIDSVPQLLPSTSPIVKSPLLKPLLTNIQNYSPSLSNYVSSSNTAFSESSPTKSLPCVSSNQKYSAPFESLVSELPETLEPMNPVPVTPYSFLKPSFYKKYQSPVTMTNMPIYSNYDIQASSSYLPIKENNMDTVKPIEVSPISASESSRQSLDSLDTEIIEEMVPYEFTRDLTDKFSQLPLNLNQQRQFYPALSYFAQPQPTYSTSASSKYKTARPGPSVIPEDVELLDTTDFIPISPIQSEALTLSYSPTDRKAPIPVTPTNIPESNTSSPDTILSNSDFSPSTFKQLPPKSITDTQSIQESDISQFFPYTILSNSDLSPPTSKQLPPTIQKQRNNQIPQSSPMYLSPQECKELTKGVSSSQASSSSSPIALPSTNIDPQLITNLLTARPIPLTPLYATPISKTPEHLIQLPLFAKYSPLQETPIEITPEKESIQSLLNKYKPANKIIPLGVNNYPYEPKSSIVELLSDLDSVKPVNPLIQSKESYVENIEDIRSNDENDYVTAENLSLDENKPDVFGAKSFTKSLAEIIEGVDVLNYYHDNNAQRPQRLSKLDDFYANNHIGKGPQVFTVPTFSTSSIGSSTDSERSYTTISPEIFRDSTVIPIKNVESVPKLDASSSLPEFYPEIANSVETVPFPNSFTQNYINPSLKSYSQMELSTNANKLTDSSEIPSLAYNPFNDINDIKYSGYKTYQMPSLKFPKTTQNLGPPPQMYSSSLIPYSPLNPVKPSNVRPIPSPPELYEPTEIYERISPQYQAPQKITSPFQTKLGLDTLLETPELNDYGTIEDEPVCVDDIKEDNELKSNLINYINKRNDIKNNFDNNNQELTIPIGNIAIIKKEPYNADTIETSNPSIGLKVWKSNVKIAQAELKLKFKDLSVVNFMPVVNNLDKYDMEEIRKIVKNYIEEKYGNHVEITEPYTVDNQYTVIKDFEPNAVSNKYNLLWPTHYV